MEIPEPLLDLENAADEVLVDAQMVALRMAGIAAMTDKLRKLIAERAFWQRLSATRGWTAKMLTKSRMRLASAQVKQSYSEDLAKAFTEKAKGVVGMS